MGFPEGREPHYYWNREQLGDGTLVGIEAVIPTSGGNPAWGGWVYESRGSKPFQGASRAAFAVLRDIMERFPQELAHAFAGEFPWGDPYTSVSDQSEVNALERSADEDQQSDSTAMSDTFAMMKTYEGIERCLGRLSGSLLIVQDEKRQLQSEFDSEVERLQGELACVTREGPGSPAEQCAESGPASSERAEGQGDHSSQELRAHASSCAWSEE